MPNIEVHTLRLQHQNMINYCYLIANNINHSAVLIDPAWEVDKIEQTIKEYSLNLSAILLTHHHNDHVNLADPLSKKYNVPIYMSQVEIETYHFEAHQLIPIKEFKSFNIAEMTITPFFSPGHTKGGTSYLIDNNLFTGDTLFIEGCGLCRTDQDADLMFETLHHFKKIITPDTLIYPGHCYGHPVGQSFEFVIKNNIYLMFTQKKQFISYRMRPNQSNLFDFK